MCTIIVAYRLFDGCPVVVAANRDELLDRPSEAPRLWNETPRFLAPVDLQRGGTWNAASETGVFAGITNRADVISKPGKVSRGDLVVMSALEPTAEAAHALVMRQDGSNFNGFHHVAAGRDGCYLALGDGQNIESRRLEPGVHVITNFGVGSEFSPNPPVRVAGVLKQWWKDRLKSRHPDPYWLQALLNIHDEKRFGTCIHEPDDNYGTKSSSVIRLVESAEGCRWQYWHRERPNRDRHVCDGRWLKLDDLPIV